MVKLNIPISIRLPYNPGRLVINCLFLCYVMQGIGVAKVKVRRLKVRLPFLVHSTLDLDC